MKIYAYLRVSTEEQSLNNSKLIIEDYLKNNKYNLSSVVWVKEKKSATKYLYMKRKIGTEILPKIKKGDIFIVSSLDRISRDFPDARAFIDKEIPSKEFVVIIAKYNLKIDSSPNPTNRMVVNMLAMLAEFEVAVLKERTKQGIKRYKQENGGKWGRPKGSLGKSKLDPKKEEIRLKIKHGVKLYKIAEDCKVSTRTLSTFIKRHNLRLQI